MIVSNEPLFTRFSGFRVNEGVCCADHVNAPVIIRVH